MASIIIAIMRGNTIIIIIIIIIIVINLIYSKSSNKIFIYDAVICAAVII